MAFANNAAWEDLPVRRAGVSRVWFRWGLSWIAAAVAALALYQLAAPALTQFATELAGAGQHSGWIVARGPHQPPAAAPAPTSAVPSSGSNAEIFLRQSLRLIQSCAGGCADRTSLAMEAQIFGEPGSAAALPGNASSWTGLPLQQSFGPQVPEPVVRPQVPPATRAIAVEPPTVAPEMPPVPAVRPAALPSLTASSAPVPVPAPAPDRSAISRSVPAAPAITAKPAPAATAALPPAAPSPVAGLTQGVAVYDISAATVYMPNGDRLEAHSGLGSMVDDPRYVDRRNVGPTPPNVYNLVMRKGRFHGVEALRLIPADGHNKFGRVGLLAHTYLLRGRPAESNGCVAFKNYARFLEAFKRGKIKQLLVVPSLSSSRVQLASAGGA